MRQFTQRLLVYCWRSGIETMSPSSAALMMIWHERREIRLACGRRAQDGLP
jgi:hypothetical protein